MSDRRPTPGAQHPDEWRAGLNPNSSAGRNDGATSPAVDAATAFDRKDLHRALSALPDDELKRIPVMP